MPIVHALGEETSYQRSKLLENISRPDRVLILAGEPAGVSTSRFRTHCSAIVFLVAWERGIEHGSFYRSC